MRRRDLLKGALGASLAGFAGADGKAPALENDQADAGLIERENRKPGALDWQLTRVRLDRRGGYRSPWIEGYCSHRSVKAGETIRIMVSTDPPSRFIIEVFRMGWYGGRGARLLKELGPLEGKTQPAPGVGRNRLRECRWAPAVELEVPPDWPSGVYLGRLSRVPEDGVSDPWQSSSGTSARRTSSSR